MSAPAALHPPAAVLEPRPTQVAMEGDEMVLSMGPQHPSTHGVLRIVLKTDGEVVKEAIPHLGYLHRCFEKHAENLTYGQVIPFTDRMDYLASMNQNFSFVVAVERLMGIQPSEREEYIRVIMAELNRIASHLVSFGTYGLDIGAVTPFLYAFRERELILDIFEAASGARLLYNYMRIGGVMRDLTPQMLDKVREFVEYFEPKIDEYNELLSFNRIFIERTASVGVLSAEQAIAYGVTGPNLRGSGVQFDIRRGDPYSIYDRFEFDIPVGQGLHGTVGDCWDRYYVRILEMRESVKILRQALAQIPAGELARRPKTVKPPKGEIYSRTESPRGELGFYVISDGTTNPLRVKARSPCFTAMSVFDELARGAMISDVIAIIGSIDIVLGEIDR